MRRDASDDGIEDRANPVLHGNSGEALGHFSLDVARGVFLFGAVGGDGGEFVIRIGIGLAREQGLDEALGDDVRKAAVGCGGVGVVLYCEAEVAGRGVAGEFENIFARPDQLDDGEREVGKMIGVGGFTLEQKFVKRFGIGIGRKFFAVLAAS